MAPFQFDLDPLKLTRPHGQLLHSLFLGAGVLGQHQRRVCVRQRRPEARVVLEGLAGRGFLAVVLKQSPVRGQSGPGARDPGGPDAQHPAQSNNGAASRGRGRGRHFEGESERVQMWARWARWDPRRLRGRRAGFLGRMRLCADAPC